MNRIPEERILEIKARQLRGEMQASFLKARSLAGQEHLERMKQAERVCSFQRLKAELGALLLSGQAGKLRYQEAGVLLERLKAARSHMQRGEELQRRAGRSLSDEMDRLRSAGQRLEKLESIAVRSRRSLTRRLDLHEMEELQEVTGALRQKLLQDGESPCCSAIEEDLRMGPGLDSPAGVPTEERSAPAGNGSGHMCNGPSGTGFLEDCSGRDCARPRAPLRDFHSLIESLKSRAGAAGGSLELSYAGFMGLKARILVTGGTEGIVRVRIILDSELDRRALWLEKRRLMSELKKAGIAAGPIMVERGF